MRSSVVALGAFVQCTGSSVHEDDVTLMQTQMRQRVSRENVPDASDIVTAIGAGASPAVASMLLEKLARNSVDTNSSIDDETKTALQSIRNTLVGTEQENIRTSHTEDQNLLNTRFATFATCRGTMTSDQAEDSATQARVDGKRTSHADCRNQLKDLETDRNTKCTFLANFEAGITVPECSAPGHDHMAQWFTTHLSWVTTTKASWTAANEDCENARTAYNDQDSTCDVTQTQFETDVCSFRVEVHSTCKSYEDCYSTAVDVYTTDLAAIRDREKGRKVDYTAIEKITCYIDVLISDEENEDRATKMKGCEAKCAVAEDGEANDCTDDLTINSHDVPDAQTCSLDAVSVYPCRDDFVAGEYTANSFIDLRECTACPDLSSHLLPTSTSTQDDCSGWSVDISHNIDGTCYMGAFDENHQRITKTFSGLGAGCTYKWTAVIDTWASVDNEPMIFTVNGDSSNFVSRSHNNCNNGWTEYPHDFGDKVGSHGSRHGGWKDCWKNFEKEFVVPADGNANVDMYMRIDQHINDEGWGWHDMTFERMSCR